MKISMIIGALMALTSFSQVAQADFNCTSKDKSLVVDLIHPKGVSIKTPFAAAAGVVYSKGEYSTFVGDVVLNFRGLAMGNEKIYYFHMDAEDGSELDFELKAPKKAFSSNPFMPAFCGRGSCEPKVIANPHTTTDFEFNGKSYELECF